MFVKRNQFICFRDVGKKCNVYNGKIYTEVLVSNFMVGHRYGEYSFTKVLGGGIHKKKKGKKGKK